VVTVRDQGIGIPEDQQQRIFERFERGVEATSYGGFGLGLWIAREIVVLSGGSISVESSKGAGASFTVRLPVGGDHT
jgi:signal transduction histidine kinase